MSRTGNNLKTVAGLLVVGIVMTAVTGFAKVKMTEGKWDGDVRKGEDCYVMENDLIKASVLKKGAYIISVVDKKTGQEFINCNKGKRDSENGLYERITFEGKHSSIGKKTEHFAVTPFDMKKEGNTLVCSAKSDTLRVDRNITLDPDLPKLKIDVRYTSVGDELLQTKICSIMQLNLDNAPIVFNQAVAIPDEGSVKVTTCKVQGFGVKDPKAGWWLIADRDSKKSIVMVHPVDPKQIEQVYQYRTYTWLHFLPFSPVVTLKKGESVSQWQEYWFLGSQKQAEGLKKDQFSELPGSEFTRMKDTLVAQLKIDALKPGCEMKIELPNDFVPGKPDPSPAGKPEATLLLVRNAVYYHPDKTDGKLWTSFRDFRRGMADVKDIKADLLVVDGASYNGEPGEFDLVKKAAALSGHKTAFSPNAYDCKNLAGYEKVFGKANWVRKVKDVVIVSYANNDPEWFKKTLDANKDKRVVVIADALRSDLCKTTTPTLVMSKLNTSNISFNREGNWAQVFNPPLQGEATVAIVNIYADFVEVYMKPVGKSFGPRLYVDKAGKSAATGVPPFMKEKPAFDIAHVTDTQVAKDSRVKINDKPLDQENTRVAFEEINKLKPAFVVNTGDLVNKGDSDEEWKIYTDLRSLLKPPVYEILGNHDYSNPIVHEDGSVTYNVDHYKKYSVSPLEYTVKEEGVLFVGFSTPTTPASYLEGLKDEAKKAKCTVLMYHDPINDGAGGYSWWSSELYKAALDLNPTILLCGHTHRLIWERKAGVNEFIGPALGWTKTGDIGWNGYFVHMFFKDRVVSNFKRLGCDDLFFTVVTPYKK